MVNSTTIPSGKLRHLERAVVAESWALRRYWHTPVVKFVANGGWRFYVLPAATRVRGSLVCGPSERGCHATRASGSPYGFVHRGARWRVALGHEIMEMLVNPILHRFIGGKEAEVCDPVVGITRQLDGEPVPDFVTPAWFTGAPGPLDWLHAL